MESIKYSPPTVDLGDSVTMDNKHASNQNDPECICVHFRAFVCLLLFCLDPYQNGGKKSFCISRVSTPIIHVLQFEKYWLIVQFSSVAQLCPTVTSWTVARQASLSITNFHSLLKLMSIETVIPSNHLLLCHPLLLLASIFPSIRVFSTELVLHIAGQSTGVSASASVLPMNIQDLFPLECTGWISLQSKGLSRVFSYTTVQKNQFLSP